MEIFTKIERAVAVGLLAIMTVVVVSGALEVAWVVFHDLFQKREAA